MATPHHTGRRRTTGLVAALPLVVAALGWLPAQADDPGFDSPQAPHVVSVRFVYTGAPELFTVPAGVTSLTVSATGAAGGDSFGDIDGGTSVGGRGAVVEGTLLVTPGQVLQVRVGGTGGDAGSISGGTGTGGWNGGGDGGVASSVGAGGGGATELRDCTASCAETSSQLIVAGGGGGAGFTQGPGTAAGADAGTAAPDYDDVRGVVTGGGAGTDAAGGAGGTVSSDFDRISNGGDGTRAQGGVGGGRTGPGGDPNATAFRGAGGGGGGVYGGGGGGDNRYYGAGGGGGSSVGKAGMSIGLAEAGAVAEVVLTYDLGPVTDLAVSAADDTIPASGTATTTVTATATTAAGVGIDGLDVSFSSTDAGQSFGPVTDEGDGIYTAELTVSTTAGEATITATADGDPDVVGTTTLTTVAYVPPTITAALSSAKPRSAGWYRTPVTVTFTCAGSRPVLCPEPFTESQNGRDQEVTGSVSDDQGGSDIVRVTFSIDRLKPTVKVTGAKNGATYSASRKLTCKAGDTLSGVRSCKVTTERKKTAKGTKVTWTGTALDKAGNSSVTRGSYTIRAR